MKRLTVLGEVDCILFFNENSWLDSIKQGEFSINKAKCNKRVKKYCCPRFKHFFYQSKYCINFFPRYCSCRDFIENWTCKHHVAVCIIMRDVDQQDQAFLTFLDSGRPNVSIQKSQ